jgi:hypothetical protein
LKSGFETRINNQDSCYRLAQLEVFKISLNSACVVVTISFAQHTIAIMRVVYGSLSLLELAALVAGTPCTSATPSRIVSTGQSLTTSGTRSTSTLTGVDLTIAITNSYGAELSLSFVVDLSTDGSAFPTPVGNPRPTVLPNAASTQYLFPPGWGGNIPIGRSIIGNNTLIEGSNNNSQPFIDVSYVNGFSVPITCSSEGKPITGCNIDLFQQPGIKCDFETAGPICNNPTRNIPDGPAACFFAACAGAAYTFPNDTYAGTSSSSSVSCCIGTPCQAPSRQPGVAPTTCSSY